MIIPRAVAADVAAIADVVERAYRGYVGRIGRRPGPMDDDYAALVASAETDVLVACGAESGGAVRGVVVLVWEPDHLLIENVAVDPDFQGRGIGRARAASLPVCTSRSG